MFLQFCALVCIEGLGGFEGRLTDEERERALELGATVLIERIDC